MEFSISSIRKGLSHTINRLFIVGLAFYRQEKNYDIYINKYIVFICGGKLRVKAITAPHKFSHKGIITISILSQFIAGFECFTK